MTGDEMERAIDFLLKSQADFYTRLEQTNSQIAETNRLLGEYANMQTTLIRVVTNTFAEQAEINRRQAEEINTLAESIREQSAAQSHTDERLNALINIVEKQISEGGHGRAS